MQPCNHAPMQSITEITIDILIYSLYNYISVEKLCMNMMKNLVYYNLCLLDERGK